MPIALSMLVTAWCGLIAWIALLAHGRGRNGFGWGAAALGGSLIGFGIGFVIAGAMFHDADITAGVFSLGAILVVPLIGMVVPIVWIALILRNAPMRVSEDGPWEVSFLSRGDGRIEVAGDAVSLAWDGQTRGLELGDLTCVEADGECVRLTLDGEELVAMPMGRPATAAGRRIQSLVIAKRLRAAIVPRA